MGYYCLIFTLEFHSFMDNRPQAVSKPTRIPLSGQVIVTESHRCCFHIFAFHTIPRAVPYTRSNDSFGKRISSNIVGNYSSCKCPELLPHSHI